MRIIRNAIRVYISLIVEEVFIIIGIGRSKVISTSKIKKITAIRKNRSEKGIRAVSNGLNPHSNGEDFSRSLFVFIPIIAASIIITWVIIMIMARNKMVSVIIFPMILLSGNQLYYLY